MQFNDRDYQLIDDGTLDTVIRVTCSNCGETWEERVSQDTASQYRDDSGELVNFVGLVDDFLDDVLCPNCEDVFGFSD